MRRSRLSRRKRNAFHLVWLMLRLSESAFCNSYIESYIRCMNHFAIQYNLLCLFVSLWTKTIKSKNFN